MLRIHVELDVHGRGNDRRTLAEIEIANVGPLVAPDRHHAYAYRIFEAASPFCHAGIDHVGYLEGYDRWQPVMSLLAAVVDDWRAEERRPMPPEVAALTNRMWGGER